MEEILRRGFPELGLDISEEQLGAFRRFYELLAEKNACMNLTAIKGEEDSARLHFLDCCALLRAADFAGKSVIDIGSGAGFPGLPLAIMEPDIALTELDSQRKRVDFVSACCAELGIKARCLACRAEEAAPDMRESYDIAVSRAVARLSALCELCLPFVRVGGLFIAMKGPGWREESVEAESAVAVLGGAFADSYDYLIPGTDVRHTAVLIEKRAPTPEKYPRRWAKITKQPL